MKQVIFFLLYATNINYQLGICHPSPSTTYSHVGICSYECLCEGGQQLYTNSKVAQLDVALTVDKHVRWLDVCSNTQKNSEVKVLAKISGKPHTSVHYF
jgi:hypothetical protein